MKTVGLFRRLLALLVDAIPTTLAYVGAWHLGLFDTAAFTPPPEWFLTEWLLKAWLDAPQTVVLPAVFAGLFLTIGNAIWESIGWSPGSKLARLHVVDGDGDRPEWWRIVLRLIGSWMNLITLSLGYLWVLADPNRRGLHDYLSGTAVIATERE